MARWREVFDEAFLKRLERLHVLARRSTSGSPAGASGARRIGDGLEFADHRDYAPGDDTRFVDWPYFARMEKLLLRLFHEHSEADVVVLPDVSGSMGPPGGRESFDWSLRAAAALAYVAMAGKGQVTVAPFGPGLLEPKRCGRDRRGLRDLLEYLAGLEPGGPTALAESCRQLALRGPRGRTVLLLSDLLDCQDQLDAALGHLARGGCDAHVVHVQSPPGPCAPETGEFVLRDVEEDAQLALWLSDEVWQAYCRCYQDFLGECRRICLARGVTYAPARTDRELDEVVLATLRRSGVVWA
jgi:uncharacterized protein (DUF58 family)